MDNNTTNNNTTENQEQYTAQPTQTPPVQSAPSPVQGEEPKSRMVAGLLGIFLGYLGIHNFYLGNTTKALIQLLVSVLTCGFGAIPMSIWGLVEGIMLLTGSITVDGKGNPLKE